MKLYNNLIKYLLKKTIIERVIIFFLFWILFFGVAYNIELITPYKIFQEDNLESLQEDINGLQNKFNIVGECKKIFCSIRSSSNNDTKFVTLGFTCNSLECYDFIYELDIMKNTLITYFKSEVIEDDILKINLEIEVLNNLKWEN